MNMPSPGLKADTKPIVESLAGLLADSYTLYLKTQNYHWNVTGPQFPALHMLFEQQYTELAVANDEIAERIRALGAPAPGSYRAFARLTAIEEEDGVPSAEGMIRNLIVAHEQISRRATEGLKHAETAGDAVTADLLTRRMDASQKAAWMLTTTLG